MSLFFQCFDFNNSKKKKKKELLIITKTHKKTKRFHGDLHSTKTCVIALLYYTSYKIFLFSSVYKDELFWYTTIPQHIQEGSILLEYTTLLSRIPPNRTLNSSDPFRSVVNFFIIPPKQKNIKMRIC